MSEPGSIARRVADSIPAATTHAWVAERIGMTAEKLSKSLNGRRVFSAVELAQLAELLGVDVFWLITGRPSPHLSTDGLGRPTVDDGGLGSEVLEIDGPRAHVPPAGGHTLGHK